MLDFIIILIIHLNIILIKYLSMENYENNDNITIIMIIIH